MVSFVAKCNLICDSQFGFRKVYSTTDTILQYIDECLNAIDNIGYIR